MKRYVIRLLSVLSILLAILFAVACSDVRYEKYCPYVEKKEVAGTPIAYEDFFFSVYCYEKEEYKLPKVPRTLTWTFMNKTYTDSWNSSDVQGKNMYVLSCNTNGGNRFSINENGQVVGFWAGNASEIRQAVTQGTKKSPEQIEAIVNSMLSEIYGEIDADFIVDVSGPHNMPAGWGDTYSAFVSYEIDGYQTTEMLTLTFALDGTLISMLSNNLGRFNGKKVPDDFSKEKADSIVRKMFKDEITDYVINSYKLDILDNGSLGMRLLIEVNVDGVKDSFIVYIPLE